MAQLVESSRGKTLLVLENHVFSKDKVLKSGEVYWRCVKKALNCTASVFTVGPDNIISRQKLEHNHQANEDGLSRKIISNACKRKAKEDISEKPSTVIRRELSSNLPLNLTVTDIANIRRNVYNCRRKLLPGALPTNIQEVHSAVEKLKPTTSKGEKFLFINSFEHNIIVFSCETNIRILCDTDILYMDGTFSYCTKYFLQMFTIHGLKNGHYVPLLFSLLPDKRTNTYLDLLSLLKSNIFSEFNLLFNPSEVYVDFEKAIHQAVNSTWPNIKINGCRFHLHQAWHRKIQSLGLTLEFSDKNSEIGKWLKHTFGLTYISQEEVEDCFAFDLMSYKPESEALDKYADYLLQVYIDKDAQFPPRIWADGNPSITRTTNACESFHSKFNSSFYSPHPAIYIFVEKLKEFQIDTYIKIQSFHMPAKIKDKKVSSKFNCLKDLANRYRSGQITRINFIKCVSYL